LFLFFYPDSYRSLFALTVVPGTIAVALIFFLPERSPVLESGGSTRRATDVSHASIASPAVIPSAFTRFMFVLTLFTLGNSTDAFLLLRLTDAAGGARMVPLAWAGLHVFKAAVSMVGGSWSDRIGRRTVIAIGWVVYAIVYGGFALSSSF